MRRPITILIVFLVLAILSADASAGVVVLHGQIVTPNGTFSGDVMFSDDTIVCVAAQCTAPTGAQVIDTHGAFVYPGFIDAHNHVAYNVLPKFTPPKVYTNRSQWQSAAAYKAFKKPYDDLKGQGLSCEMVKYGEIRA